MVVGGQQHTRICDEQAVEKIESLAPFDTHAKAASSSVPLQRITNRIPELNSTSGACCRDTPQKKLERREVIKRHGIGCFMDWDERKTNLQASTILLMVASIYIIREA